MKKLEKLKIFQDLIVPIDFEEVKDTLDKLIKFGIEDMEFQFDDGVDIIYDSNKLSPGSYVDGEVTLCEPGDNSSIILYIGLNEKLDHVMFYNSSHEVINYFKIDFNLDILL